MLCSTRSTAALGEGAQACGAQAGGRFRQWSPQRAPAGERAGLVGRGVDFPYSCHDDDEAGTHS